MKKILIVDDSATVRLGAKMVLEDAGYEVIETQTPLFIGAKIAREQIDLVLLDVEMPLTTGDRAAELLDAESSAKVVFYSSLPEAELQAKADEAGISGFIRKVPGQKNLISRVISLIGPPI